MSDRLTDEAVRLIQGSDGTPFFLNLWHYAVHIPVQAPQALVEKYSKKRTDMGLDKCVELEEGEWFPTMVNRTKHIIRRRIQSDPVYAAMIENVDTNVGRILDALKRRLDGVDIYSLLTGGDIDERPIFWHYPHYGDQGGTPAAAVRQ